MGIIVYNIPLGQESKQPGQGCFDSLADRVAAFRVNCFILNTNFSERLFLSWRRIANVKKFGRTRAGSNRYPKNKKELG